MQQQQQKEPLPHHQEAKGAAATEASAQTKTATRFEWTQSPKRLFITIFSRSLNSQSVKHLDFGPFSLRLLLVLAPIASSQQEQEESRAADAAKNPAAAATTACRKVQTTDSLSAVAEKKAQTPETAATRELISTCSQVVEEGESENCLEFNFPHLFAEIEPSECSYTLSSKKVEIVLKKKETGFHWISLEAPADGSTALLQPVSNQQQLSDTCEDVKVNVDHADASVKHSSKSKDGDAPGPAASAKVEFLYPSSKKKVDWDRLEKEIEKDLEEENKAQGGDGALQKFFQQIYRNADEDTRRAMIKSYQTSGGTVLSTNWAEVQQKNFEKEVQAPAGQEVRRWTDH